MRVNYYSCLAGEVSEVMLDISVTLYKFKNCGQHPEEIRVPALVERLNELFDVCELVEIDNSLGRVQDLLLDLDSVHMQQSRQNCISDQALIRHYLRAVEGGQHLYEQS